MLAVARPVLSHPFPVIVASAASTTAGSASQVVSLPSGIGAGDLLLLLGGAHDNGRTPSASGWTVGLSAAAMNTQGEMNALWKSAAGNEGASVTVTLSASSTGAWVAYLIRQWRGTPQFTSTTTVSPPSLSVAASWQLSATLWLAFYAGATSANPTITIPPNYRDKTESAVAASIIVDACWRNRMWNAEQPAAFVETGGSVLGRGTATVAIRGK